MIRAAKIESSQRLQRFLGVLADGSWKSTMTIIREAGIAAVSAVASEVRANGIEVDCRRVGRVFEYSLPCRRAA